jgi:eukaryotic-like serine/threonine-protein kinase
MALSTGSRLGPYTISGLLGAGGMGEVYRAYDDRLARDVAIKILTGNASADPDLQRRFASEARAASALNHPNILTVHDVGMEKGIPYIVSELVDGEPLRSLIARGPVPVKQLLDIAVQVASGLAAAHHAGIVHRDLKPANLMLTKSGFAKILDFGLAKAVIGKTVSPRPASSDNTSPGLIVGTANYMSPEQARGDPVDHRSDQFSFGLVLYEMLAGKPAFARDTSVGTMAAIVEEPAPPLAEVSPAAPAPLRWCIERCLAKDREERYVSTADLQRELQTLRARWQEVASPKPEPSSRPVPRRRKWLVPLLVGLAGMLAGVAAGVVFLVPDTAVDMARYRLQPVASVAPRAGSPVWSHDGRSLAYTAEVNGIQQVFVRELTSPTPAQITNAATDCEAPFWFPEDTMVAYLGAQALGTDLYVIGATGGSPRLLQANVSAATLAPDGKNLVFLRRDPPSQGPLSLWTAPLSGGMAQKVETGPFSSGKYESGYLASSPDGKKLGAWISRWDGGSEFWVLPWPGGPAQQSFSFVAGIYPFSWMPDSRHLVFGGVVPGSFGADLQMVDSRSGRLRPLTQELKDATEASVSPDGQRIAFSAGEDDFDIVSVSLAGQGLHPLLASGRNELDPAWSPIAEMLAVATDRTGTSQIWARNLRDGSDRPLVTGLDFGTKWIASFSEPVFSPDGRRLAYSVLGSDGHSIYISSVAGGKPVRLSTEHNDERAPTWSADGNWIAYLRNTGRGWALVKASSSGSSQATLLADAAVPGNPQWNHAGGHEIAYLSGSGLTIVSEDGKQSRVVSQDPWLVFGWSSDGRFLEGVTRADTRRLTVAVLDVQKGAERIVSDLAVPPGSEIRGFSLAADGESFATSISRDFSHGSSKKPLLLA